MEERGLAASTIDGRALHATTLPGGTGRLGAGGTDAGGSDTQVLPGMQVAGEVAQDSDDELAFLGRTLGGTFGVAALSLVVGGTLIVVSRRHHHGDHGLEARRGLACRGVRGLASRS